MKIDVSALNLSAATVTVPVPMFLALLKAAGADAGESFGWTKEVVAEAVTEKSRRDKNAPVERVSKFAIGDRVIADTVDGIFPGKVTAVTKRTYDVLCDNGDEYEAIGAEFVYSPDERAKAEENAKALAEETAAAEAEKSYERARITVALLTPGVKAADLTDFGGKRFAIMASIVGLNPFKDLKGVEGADRYKAVVKAAKAKQGEPGSAKLLKAAKATVAAYEAAQVKAPAKEAAPAKETEYKAPKNGLKVGDWVRIGETAKGKVETIKVKGSSLKVFVRTKDSAHTVIAAPDAFVKDGKTATGIIWKPTAATIATA